MGSLVMFDLPFAVLAVFYPLLRHQVDNHVFSCLLKCLPMSFLIFVLVSRQRSKPNTYTRNILIGLVCSVVGDAFLVYTDTCPHSLLGGVIAFGVAHLFYIAAFGLKPFKVTGVVIVCAISLVAFVILRKELEQMGQIYLVVVPVYMALLLSMAWRAIVRANAKVKGSNQLSKVGAISFVFSDGILALTELTHIVPANLVSAQLSTILVLSTYYLAQYCFAKTALVPTTGNIGGGGGNKGGKSKRR